METVSIKLEDNFAKDLDKTIKKNHYTTKTEFIREAIRDKMKDLQKEEMLLRAKRLYGASKRKTTDEELHMAREKAFDDV
jgi:metal-responsive CopG/Arc/MetJ family transcriptional regulator